MGQCVSPDNPRRTRILAKSIFKELRASGLPANDMIGLATELLGLVADHIQSQR